MSSEKISNEKNVNGAMINLITSFPTEEQVLQTIFDCVFIRGVELKDYERNFSNEQSGLYDAIIKLMSGDSHPTEEQVLQTIFNCVFIRGLELEYYERNFSNEQGGLYDALIKLFNVK